MVYNILIAFWSILLIIILFLMYKSLTAKYHSPGELEGTEYPFQNWEKSDLPFINIDVQGHSLNMIVDSAGAVSIIRKSVLKNLKYEKSCRRVELVALTNDGMHSEVVTIPININGTEFKTDFVVYDSDDFAEFKKHGIIMDGLLGVEFLKVTKGFIDFKNQTVKFP